VVYHSSCEHLNKSLIHFIQPHKSEKNGIQVCVIVRHIGFG
jgi:hypothetical protein